MTPYSCPQKKKQFAGSSKVAACRGLDLLKAVHQLAQMVFFKAETRNIVKRSNV
jgi:hypothetical protein